MYFLLVLCFFMLVHKANRTEGMEVDGEVNRETLFRSYEGYALEGSVTAVYQVNSPLRCALYGTRDSTCKSFNLKTTKTPGKFRCELNNATKNEKSSLYVNTVRSTYYEAIQTESKEPTYEKSRNCLVGQEYNFTTLGASGRHGPTSLGNHYQGQPHQHQVTLINGTQQWTVPITGQYRIEAVGATGGYDVFPNSSLYRGLGARMIGTFTLNQDEVVQILVGQEGGINTAYPSSGGGGGSFVVRGSTPLIVAGGGGGVTRPSSRHPEYCDAGNDKAGRRGYGRLSWPGGTEGHGATFANGSDLGGGGGGFYSDGQSGTNFGGSSSIGGEGGKGFLNGGTGGRSYYSTVPGGFGGGGGAYGYCCSGGGGGYSGGASGSDSLDSCGGGGGSYNAGTDQQNTCCVNDKGHGYVLVRLLSCFP